jgi:methanogenic corrinoid protein MtbC1
MENLELEINALERALLLLDHSDAERIVRDAISKGSPIEISSELVSQTLQRIGDAWEERKLALSQVYMSGIICEEIIDKILPATERFLKDQPKMAIAVFEDQHLLGKRIIYATLRASGFALLDLGGGLSIDNLIEIVKREDIKILLLSVLMLPSALRIKELKKKLSDTNVKIIVGGAPFRFDLNLWKEVGADGFGKDSSGAIHEVTKLMKEFNESK